MTKNINKITACLLLTLLSFTICFQNWSHIATELINIRQRFLIEKKSATHFFTFSVEEWQKIKHQKEFQYHSEFYDIKNWKENNNSILVEVIKDKHENILKFIDYSLKKIQKEKTKNKKASGFDLYFKKEQICEKHPLNYIHKNKFIEFYKYYITPKNKQKKPPKGNLI